MYFNRLDEQLHVYQVVIRGDVFYGRKGDSFGLMCIRK